MNRAVLNDSCYKRKAYKSLSRPRRFDDRGKNRKCKLSPDTGKVAALADGRGKYEQTRKNE